MTGSDAPDGPFDGPALPVDDADELAGVVDLFGALSPDEVTAALVELAYRQRGSVDEETVAAAADRAVASAVERYYLVWYTPDDDGGTEAERADEPTHLTVGPVAFPSLPAAAEDLPHILDYPTTAVHRASLARAVEERLRGDAARAVAADDHDRIQRLFDVTYDLEAWAPVDVAEVRERLEAALATSDRETGSD